MRVGDGCLNEEIGPREPTKACQARESQNGFSNNRCTEDHLIVSSCEYLGKGL
jgi:hypothetical protein